MPRKNPEENYPEFRCQAMVFDMYGRKIKGPCINAHHFQINKKNCADATQPSKPCICASRMDRPKKFFHANDRPMER